MLKTTLQIICLIFSSYFVVPVALLALTYPPTISSQGVAHRIFYWHVPIAWVALYAPLLAAFCGLIHIWTKKEIYDIWSIANAKIAYLFSLAVLVSGPLWASTEWGTYWNWKDSRLISFFILFLCLNGYFLVRKFIENSAQETSSAALLAILSAIASLLTWFAIRWIEPDTHPPSVLDKMSHRIALTFWISVLAYHFLFWILTILSVRQEKIYRWKKQKWTSQ